MWLLLYPQHSFMSMNQLTHNSWPQLMVGDRIGHLDDTKVRMRKMVRGAREFVSHKNRDMSGFGCVVMFRLCCCIALGKVSYEEKSEREGKERREKERRGERRRRERERRRGEEREEGQGETTADYETCHLSLPSPPSFSSLLPTCKDRQIAKGRKEQKYRRVLAQNSTSWYLLPSLLFHWNSNFLRFSRWSWWLIKY